MKFKPGNLLKNKRNDGLWLVTEVQQCHLKLNKRDAFKMRLDAACVQPGKCRVNLVGDVDIWYFTELDGSDKAHQWIVINEV